MWEGAAHPLAQPRQEQKCFHIARRRHLNNVRFFVGLTLLLIAAPDDILNQRKRDLRVSGVGHWKTHRKGFHYCVGVVWCQPLVYC